MADLLERLILRVGRVTAWLALVIVLVMATNVILRYSFSYGSVWAQELEWHLLVPLALFSIPYALACGESVRVDVVYSRFPSRMQQWVDVIAACLGLAMALLITWFSINYVNQAWVIDEGSADPGGLPHRWLLKGLIPVGMVLLALQFVAEILKSVARLRGAAR